MARRILGMGLGVIAAWAILAWRLLEDNEELLDSIEAWRSVLATVILTLGAPVFFLSDLLEVLLDLIAGEEE